MPLQSQRVLAVAPIHFNACRAVECKGRTRQSAGPPLLSLL
jgi:hypothetical protein